MVARASASPKEFLGGPALPRDPRPGDHPAMLAFGFSPDSPLVFRAPFLRFLGLCTYELREARP